jgi:hypothetical protein
MDMTEDRDVPGYMTLEGKPHHYSSPGSGPRAQHRRRAQPIDSDSSLSYNKLQDSGNPAIPPGWDYVGRPRNTRRDEPEEEESVDKEIADRANKSSSPAAHRYKEMEGGEYEKEDDEEEEEEGEN